MYSQKSTNKMRNLTSVTFLLSISALIVLNANRFSPISSWYDSISTPSKAITVVDSTESNAKLHQLTKPPEVLPTDLIYQTKTAFVIPEYKLIFFTFPKVACSEWKRMFMRMNDNNNWCKIRGFNAHDQKLNKIEVLSDYPTEMATAMMTSPVWTKAAVVREPKERVLSAFLDKAVKERTGTKGNENGGYYVRKCCNKIPNPDLKQECIDNEQDFQSFLFFVTKYRQKCFDVHWEAQVSKIDPKWWPYIDFIGHQNNLAEDGKKLLQTLTSTRDTVPNRTAWERYGATGWGNDNELCEKRPNGFLEENTSTHNINTGSHLLEWYTPEAERMVETNWAVEWQQKEIKFPEVHLFPDKGERL
mmetsp:Transcript_352/g.492  ORF Transcript_352/g.492 Transcript_352/m.492 type:complete len:360 (-) Transcript_352:2544-3623(-)